MKFLLDTHIFLWFISGDKRLPAAMRNTILNLNNEVFLSVVSVWERILKNQIGKLPLPQNAGIYIPHQRRKHKIKSLNLGENAIKQLANLPNLHRDPFDRLLICQTLSGKMTILTVDAQIRAYSVPCF
jgi:PIN domain nuclease of toxin-antitoxin system